MAELKTLSTLKDLIGALNFDLLPLHPHFLCILHYKPDLFKRMGFSNITIILTVKSFYLDTKDVAYSLTAKSALNHLEIVENSIKIYQKE
jgi:hypothetical protein